MKKAEKCPKPWQMGTHMKVLGESFPMNTNMTGFRCFSKLFVHLCALDKNSLSIGRVKSLWLVTCPFLNPFIQRDVIDKHGLDLSYLKR